MGFKSKESQSTREAADATLLGRYYVEETILPRHENPLIWWRGQETVKHLGPEILGNTRHFGACRATTFEGRGVDFSKEKPN